MASANHEEPGPEPAMVTKLNRHHYKIDEPSVPGWGHLARQHATFAD